MSIFITDQLMLIMNMLLMHYVIQTTPLFESFSLIVKKKKEIYQYVFYSIVCSKICFMAFVNIHHKDKC